VLTLRSTAAAIALVPIAMMLAAQSRPIVAAQGTGAPVSGTIVDSRTERLLTDVVVSRRALRTWMALVMSMKRQRRGTIGRDESRR
jgi:hypothetical protein